MWLIFPDFPRKNRKRADLKAGLSISRTNADSICCQYQNVEEKSRSVHFFGALPSPVIFCQNITAGGDFRAVLGHGCGKQTDFRRIAKISRLRGFGKSRISRLRGGDFRRILRQHVLNSHVATAHCFCKSDGVQVGVCPGKVPRPRSLLQIPILVS